MPVHLYLFVAELDPAVGRKKRVAARNPGWDGKKPCVYVGFTNGVKPERRFPDGNFSKARTRYLKFGQSILNEYTTEHSRREGVLSRQQERIEELRKEGWCVANSPPIATYSVYVVELEPAVADLPEVQELNPDRDPEKPCTYVGQTGKTPERQLVDHLASVHGPRYVTRETVIGLRHDLFESLNPMTELESLRKEQSLATQLRQRGWTVVSGH